jgi:succinate-semialdehyde dehydrogenase/glutarate-semialdehyde dehydrogenase
LPEEGQVFHVINPATGETIAHHPMHDTDAVRGATRAASEAFDGWRRRSFAERASVLRAAAARLRARQVALAELMATEMGKPVTQGRREVEKCAWVCEHYAEHGAAYLADDPIATEARESFAACQPLGPILAIMPWNFPLWQVFRAAAPSLMAGNVMLLKHASNVPGCALAIAEIWEEAGLPAGGFQSLLVDAAGARRLIRTAAVRAVTLTGSTAAGRAVAREAGARLKKTVLELGGSDPYLILEDADLTLAVEACVTSRLLNTGQSCIAAKRFIVVESVRPEFEERFVARMAEAVVGDPLEEATTVGPMARTDLRDELHDQVVRSQVKGARLILGGRIPERPGAWYPPTVLTDVPRGAAAWREELFGPVAAIIPVRSERAAITAANASPFGLGAAVFTRDLDRGRRIARDELEAGCCVVNTYVASDPRLPFGGILNSGYGRELGREGIREFVNLKSVVVA